MTDALLRITGLNKSFWNVPVLLDVDFEVRRGEVHALVGENGAGKSTLIKIICCAYQRDSGRIVFDGREFAAADPGGALERGIAVIHQETSLIPTLTVIENVFLGIEPVYGLFGVCRRDVMRERFFALCRRVGFALPPDRKVRSLGPAERKLAEIVKALAHDARLIIMDEPTDSLGGGEIEAFFRVVNDLKARGVTVIYITHYLGELFRISDRVTVLKDGVRVATENIGDVTAERIVKLMLGSTGRGAAGGGTEGSGTPGKGGGPPGGGGELLRAEGLRRGDAVLGVDLTLRRGEITGLVGVIGSGKTELARLLFGADRMEAGAVTVRGGRTARLDPVRAKRAGIGFLPEDRKTQGLIHGQAVGRNLTLAALDKVSWGEILSPAAESAACRELVDSLSIKIAGLGQRVRHLSGGNQQKVVLGKWLFAGPEILILDEPTRGIDVGSKRAIYKLVAEIARQGKAVLFISSEVPEILEVADRILVMRKGAIAGELPRGARQEEVLGMMLEA
ncbi:MAG: sugar ABC transporter ATP-binding protein [Planctomycetota bacterium]|jgi:ABC-type sugar transport system ATPase subunit|nr:sugar ABC transporter ATP-binding protein [Planctomycetota bacterium]